MPELGRVSVGQGASEILLAFHKAGSRMEAQGRHAFKNLDSGICKGAWYPQGNRTVGTRANAQAEFL